MELLDVVAKNWQWFVLGFMALEKIVKVTPTKWDDIVLDMVLKPIFNSLKAQIENKEEKKKNEPKK